VIPVAESCFSCLAAIAGICGCSPSAGAKSNVALFAQISGLSA